jgi:hypothetical protein
MGEDVRQMKTTRERLLALFERPGWGAKALRAFRDGQSSRGFDEIPIREERGPSRTKIHEAVTQSRSPQGTSDNVRWIPDTRPRRRRESRIQDKIRLFDGAMDFPPSGYQDPWKLNGAEGAVPSQLPTKYRPIVSPTRPGIYSVFPQKYQTGTLTPIKSYGYLRPKVATPLPWRPLDSRKWETVTNLINSPETPNVGGPVRKRVEHSLITPTPTNAASAVKKVQITYQDPKRNFSEKVSVLYAKRSKEREQEGLKSEIQEEDPNTGLDPFTQALSSRKTTKKQAANDEVSFEKRGTLESHEVESLERSKPAKGSKIQDRINLFTNEGAATKSLGVPMTRMRNQSTPTKLPPQAAYRGPTTTSSRAPQTDRNTRSQIEKHFTEVAEVAAADPLISDMLLGKAADQQRSGLYTEELVTQAPAPRKSSGISDKIEQFEAFASGQAASIRRPVFDSNRKRFSPQSKRIQTWPILASENLSNSRTEYAEVPQKSVGEQQVRSGVEKTTNSASSESTETEKDKAIMRLQYRERARYKIHARQERLNRRSRSRSRSAASISVPSNELEAQRQAFKLMSEYFGAKSQQGRRSGKEKAAKEVEMELEIALDTDSHAQRPGHETVQEIWVDSSEDGPSKEVVIVDTVVAQCELAEPTQMRLAETLRMIRLCRGRFAGQSETLRRKVGRSSEKFGGFAA